MFISLGYFYCDKSKHTVRISVCVCGGGGGYQRGPIASQRGSVPVFLMKHIATCGFPGGRVRSPLL